MKYSTLKELTASAAAEQYKLENTPPDEAVENLTGLAEKVLDPLREAWGAPVKLTCAYRSREVNKKVGGHPDSRHLYGCAADIVCAEKDQVRMMKILTANPHVDLCQNYPDRNFIHVNTARPGEKPRRLALTQYKNKKAVPYIVRHE